MAGAEAMSVRAASGPLLERERELDEIGRLLTEVCSGAGELLVVESPAGVGKTRLLEAVCDTGRERGMVVLAAAASELERDLAFGVVRSLFEVPLARLTTGRRPLAQTENVEGPPPR